MKKFLKLCLVLFVVILISGCRSVSESKKVCTLTKTDSVNGYKINSTYTMYIKGKVVTKVETEEVVTSDNDDILNYFEEQVSKQYDAASKNYGGYTVNITNKDGKVTSNVIIDYTKMDLDKFINDNSAMKHYVDSKGNLLVTGIQSLYESLGATCE